MPYKSGTLKGQLTTAEIRKLVRAHNKLSKITIPPKSSREEILSIISKAGFRVNHEKQLLEQSKANKRKNRSVTLEKAKDVTKPVKKTEEQKQQAKAKKEAKVKEQKTKEAELIKKGAVIGKLVAKKQMAKEQKKEVKKVVKKDVTKDDTEKFKKVWDSVKDLNWKENVRTQILTLFNTGSRVPANKKYHIIKDAQIKNNKLINKYVLTRQRAEEVLERDKGEGSEEEVIKLTTKLSKATFTIPKGKEQKN